MSAHSVWVEPADPVGMLEMFHARCICGWGSEPTDEKRLAEKAKGEHRRETYEVTMDDLQWMAGTGRWAQ